MTRSKDNTMITHLAVVMPPNQVSPHHHIMVRQVRNSQYLAGTVRQSHQTIIGNSSTMVTGFPQAACVRRIVLFSTLYFQAKVQRQQETSNVVVQTNKKTAITRANRNRKKTWTGTLYWAYIDTGRLTTYEICDI
jgi:hypothetical protein